MDPAVLTGSFALAGVVVGGATRFVAGVLQQRRERQLSARIAARLCLHEVGEVFIHVGRMTSCDQMSEFRQLVQNLKTPLLDAYAADLAATVDDDAWLTLNEVRRMVRELVVRAGDGPADAPVDSLLRARIQQFDDHMTKAMVVTGRLVDPALDRRFRRRRLRVRKRKRLDQPGAGPERDPAPGVRGGS
jgi:hypothetical protein